MKPCTFCSKQIEDYINYCSWECNIAEAKKNGGQVFQPNGLPIQCIRYDNNMYEIEHGDHPDYKFPITVEGINEDGPAKEVHALIYSDGCIAVSIYECNYAFWYVDSGKFVGGKYWDNTWNVCQESMLKISQTYDSTR